MNNNDYNKAKKYSELRKAGKFEEAKKYANLSRTDLSEANLIEADLSEANLIEADLSGATVNIGNVYRRIEASR